MELCNFVNYNIYPKFCQRCPSFRMEVTTLEPDRRKDHIRKLIKYVCDCDGGGVNQTIFMTFNKKEPLPEKSKLPFESQEEVDEFRTKCNCGMEFLLLDQTE